MLLLRRLSMSLGVSAGRVPLIPRRVFSASLAGDPKPEGAIIVERPSACMATVILNRPKALNALTEDMCEGMKNLQLEWREARGGGSQPPPHLFVLRGRGRAFCAGGDVKAVWQELQGMKKEEGEKREKGVASVVGTGRRGSLHADFFRKEYEMNYLLGTSKVVQVSLWDGTVMGGGVGISIFGAYRVATENTLFAMPETGIGLFPDVGSSSWLPGLQPPGFGLYLGLTGVRIRASDLLKTGIATHYVTSDKLRDLEDALSSLETTAETAAAKVGAVLQRFQGQSIQGLDTSSSLLPHFSANISNTFGPAAEGAGRLEEAIKTLHAAASTCAWSRDTLQLISKMSPTSLRLTYQQLQQGRGKDLRDCLIIEYRLMMRCLAAHDFSEGIRALLVDKDQQPKWRPAMPPDDVDDYFLPLAKQNELHLSTGNRRQGTLD